MRKFFKDINRDYAIDLNYHAIDNFIVKVLWWHLVVFVVVATLASLFHIAQYIPSPLSWRVISLREAAGATIIAIMATAIPMLVRNHIRNHYFWRLLITLALTIYSFLFVFISGGAIEMHFHFFIVAGLLVIYADWRLGWLLLVLTAFHHEILNTVAPDWVYFYGHNDLSVVSHAVPVLIMVIFTTILCRNHRSSIVVLDREKSRREASINGLETGFIMLDVDEAIVMINEQAKQILLQQSHHVGTPEVPPSPWTLDFIQGMTLENFNLRTIIGECLEKQAMVTVKEVSNGERFLNITAVPIVSMGGNDTIGTVITLTDITEQKILDRSKDEFFSIASHELRTPLTSIRGNTSMIMQQYPKFLKDKTLNDMVSDIHESSVRLIGIVNDFLDVSRLEQGKLIFAYEEFSLDEVIDSVIYELEEVLKEKKLWLKFDRMPHGKLPPVWADKNRTKQVLYNLIGNATKFTDTGGITISTESNDKNVKVLITDTGRGIPSASLKLLFRKFQQAGSSLITRDASKGTGLGLFISKKLVESMGGTIAIEQSKEGVGSTFSFILSIATAKLKLTAKTSQVDPNTGISLEQPKEASVGAVNITSV